MTETQPFPAYRDYVFAIAYRMLGSVMDAEDMVQETFLRWREVDQEAVANPKAFLATIVTRLCLDHLRSARVRRETYIGPWLPEPLVAGGPSVEGMTAMADSLSTAFLVLLESLTPVERAAFLLREVFAYDYGEVAEIIGKSEANTRQIARRARQHIEERRPRFAPTPDGHAALLEAFTQAITGGDLNGLTALLAEDVVHYSDGGGKFPAARKPIYGADKVAAFLLGIVRLAPATASAQPGRANGQPALILYNEDRPYAVLTVEIDAGRIRNVFAVANPDKLGDVPRLGTLGRQTSDEGETE